MKFSELIEHAVECIKTFNPVIKTIDSHADSFLEKVSCNPRLHHCFTHAVIQATGAASNHSYLFTLAVETKIYFANAFLLYLVLRPIRTSICQTDLLRMRAL